VVHGRLHHALSVIFGIEPWVVLKDIWDLPDREVERISLWMADALIDAALREGRAAGNGAAARPPAHGKRARPMSPSAKGSRSVNS